MGMLIVPTTCGYSEDEVCGLAHTELAVLLGVYCVPSAVLRFHIILFYPQPAFGATILTDGGGNRSSEVSLQQPWDW